MFGIKRMMSVGIMLQCCLTLFCCADAEERSFVRYADQNGISYFVEDNKYGLVSGNDEILFPPVFDKVWPFEGDYAVVESGAVRGCIDCYGNMIVYPDWSNIAIYDHFIIGSNQDCLSAIFDLNGRLLSSGTFYHAKESGGRLIAYDSIDTKGTSYVFNLAFELCFSFEGYISGFSEGYAGLETEDSIYYIDADGNIAFQKQGVMNPIAYNFRDGIAIYQYDHNAGLCSVNERHTHYCCMDSSLNVLYETITAKDIYNAGNGLIVYTSKEDKQGIINAAGQTMIQPVWDFLYYEGADRVIGRANGKAYLLDLNGNAFLGPYDDIYWYNLQRSWVCEDGILYLVDQAANCVNPNQWKSVCVIDEGRAFAKDMDDIWKLVDDNGNILKDLGYRSILIEENYYLSCTYEGCWYYIDKNGDPICAYEFY